MGSRTPTRTVRCSQCSTTLAFPSFARTVCCPICHHTTYVGWDPVRHAVGFVKSAVANFANTANSSNDTDSGYYLPPRNPHVFGKKKALLIGITYSLSQHELKGSINDVRSVASLLTQKFGFPMESILILTDKHREPNKIPTRENMLAAMQWLVSGCTAGDSLVFYFSGHGTQVPDEENDEWDGKNEVLCPVDYKTNGLILDNDINKIMVRLLPYDVKLHAIIDACNSGTSLDLPYSCRISRRGSCQWEDQRPPSGQYKGTSGGLAILISGCDDHQNSEEKSFDPSDFSGSSSTGAMTYSFIQAVESEPVITYGRLLIAMKAVIDKNGNGSQFSGPQTSLLRRANSFSSTQDPQLSSSEMFDIFRKPFLL